MPFVFRRQRFPYPPRICLGLRVTHIRRPVQRQWNFIEHRAIKPSAAVFRPENWMLHPARGLPVPGIVIPETPRFIATGADEFEVLLICHHKLIDGESWHTRGVDLIFVIPAESLSVTSKAQSCSAGWNLDHSMCNGRGD